MYIINLTYHRPMEEVEALIEPHLQWLDRYFAAGVFITAGRKDPRTGGLIIAKDIDRQRLDAIVAEDPFVAVANYEVTKVNITLAAEEFKALVGI
ncbi:YciI family protein [Erwiniaceae bacterium BAC15a-03b]|uniref:YciI family protein n=1 Tax=Winslowiella arboricola TaxID=2978220 RepID=A0A9J6PT11_9GAMM|nr:YciI family protein [Winslowiella arboricola]MCU5772993.1 YciI family protein [Winslowiella arboricola]MCU5777892.1 YciI family protein [Winslowiella arboricola]